MTTLEAAGAIAPREKPDTRPLSSIPVRGPRRPNAARALCEES